VMYVLLFHQPALRVDAPEGPTVEETIEQPLEEHLRAKEAGT
jgi:hypothetical protein